MNAQTTRFGPVEVDPDRIMTFEGHRAPIWSLAWNADERFLLSASGDGTTRLWKIPAAPEDALRGRLRARLRRCPDPDFYVERLRLSESEATRRESACRDCLPEFFAALGDAPAAEPEAAERAWRVYETCFFERLAD